MTDSASILQAILTRHLVTFTYQGFPRTCEPHVLGVSNGIPQVLCYQVEGDSLRDRLPAWRRFDLSDIFNLFQSEETFPGVRIVPHPHSVGWDQIISVVS